MSLFKKLVGVNLKAALGGGVMLQGRLDARERRKKMRAAARNKAAVEKAIRDEQIGRERRKQIRTATVLGAQADVIQSSTGSGVSTDTPIASVQSEISANLAGNLGEMATGIAGSTALTASQNALTRAGKKSSMEILGGHVEKLFVKKLFKG